MASIVLDAATIARLGELAGAIEVYDPAGKIIGYFHHFGDFPRTSPISEVELRRRQSQRTGRSLTEILDDLQAQ